MRTGRRDVTIGVIYCDLTEPDAMKSSVRRQNDAFRQTFIAGPETRDYAICVAAIGVNPATTVEQTAEVRVPVEISSPGKLGFRVHIEVPIPEAFSLTRMAACW
jgi:hypothetical protein